MQTQMQTQMRYLHITQVAKDSNNTSGSAEVSNKSKNIERSATENDIWKEVRQKIIAKQQQEGLRTSTNQSASKANKNTKIKSRKGSDTSTTATSSTKVKSNSSNNNNNNNDSEVTAVKLSKQFKHEFQVLPESAFDVSSVNNFFNHSKVDFSWAVLNFNDIPNEKIRNEVQRRQEREAEFLDVNEDDLGNGLSVDAVVDNGDRVDEFRVSETMLLDDLGESSKGPAKPRQSLSDSESPWPSSPEPSSMYGESFDINFDSAKQKRRRRQKEQEAAIQLQQQLKSQQSQQHHDAYHKKKLKLAPQLLQELPEVVFIGKCNVGKSSLLNSICTAISRKSSTEEIAFASKKAGFTKTINCFTVGQKFRIIDTPGYGVKSTLKQGEEIVKYLTDRKELRKVYLLINATRGFSDHDYALILNLLAEKGIPFNVIFTKIDKLRNTAAMKKVVHEFEKIMKENDVNILPDYLFSSSVADKKTGRRQGVTEIRYDIIKSCGLPSNLKLSKNLKKKN